MTGLLRVLVLADAPERGAALRGLLQAQGAAVVGVARSAVEAVEIGTRRIVDVVLLATRQSALEAVAPVRHIMQVKPVPIVVLAQQPAGGAPAEVLEAGALALLHQPAGAPTPAFAAELVQKLQLMAEVKVVRRWAKKPLAAEAALPRPVQRRRPAGGRAEIVAIGASTGGPVALKTILAALPASFPAPVVVVQHMAAGFLDGLAEWLTTQGAVRAVVPCRGAPLLPGHAYLAPDGMHMCVSRHGTIEFEDGPPVHGHRPAVGRLFESVASHFGPRAIAILLTGMGADGADELRSVQDAGGITIAQDVASSVVHGMPGTAIRAGAATYIMSPEEIALALPGLVRQEEGFQ